MSVPAGQPLSIQLTEAYPIGQSVFPAWYFDFLTDLARLPWPRIPQTYARFAVKAAAELTKSRQAPPKVLIHG